METPASCKVKKNFAACLLCLDKFLCDGLECQYKTQGKATTVGSFESKLVIRVHSKDALIAFESNKISPLYNVHGASSSAASVIISKTCVSKSSRFESGPFPNSICDFSQANSDFFAFGKCTST